MQDEKLLNNPNEMGSELCCIWYLQTGLCSLFTVHFIVEDFVNYFSIIFPKQTIAKMKFVPGWLAQWKNGEMATKFRTVKERE